MDKFMPGTICFHKATSKRCVVIKQNAEGTVKVRDQDDSQKDYYPQELETQAEYEERHEAMAVLVNRANKERAEKIEW